MSYDFDEGDSGSTAQGPFLNWHARAKHDNSIEGRSFSLRSKDDDGNSSITDVTDKMKKAVAFDLDTLKTGWCFSNGTPGISPEWVWNTSPARFDQAQPADRGEDRWKKGFSVRLAIGKEACTWSQAGAGAWTGLVNLIKAVKKDGGDGDVVVAFMEGVEEIKFAKGGTSAPEFTVKKWADRPDCLTQQAEDAPAVEEDDSEDEF